jgi:membrane protein implicated in regulation of membrane protease activity
MEISFFGSLACAAEVSLLEALHGGVPEGACIGVGAGTVAVVVLFLVIESLVVLWIVRRARARRTTPAPAPADPGPIWSARAGRDGGPIR